MARPSKYQPEFVAQAEKLCRLGATDKQVADFFGVSEQTLNAWKQRAPAFLESLKRGKEFADAHVEQSLYHRAIGYEHPEIHITNYQGEIKKTPITKRYPPDTTAGIFWLKNRQPVRWRETKAIELTGANGGAVRVVSAQMSPEEAERAYKEAMSGAVLQSAG